MMYDECFMSTKSIKLYVNEELAVANWRKLK